MNRIEIIIRMITVMRMRPRNIMMIKTETNFTGHVKRYTLKLYRLPLIILLMTGSQFSFKGTFHSGETV